LISGENSSLGEVKAEFGGAVMDIYKAPQVL